MTFIKGNTFNKKSKGMSGKTHTQKWKDDRSNAMKGKIPKNLSLINANKNGAGNPMWKGGEKR